MEYHNLQNTTALVALLRLLENAARGVVPWRRGLSLGETVGPWHGLGSELSQQLVTSSSGVFSPLGACHDQGLSSCSVTGLYNTEYSS